MWKGNKVSIVLPTYNEKESIKHCIEDFFATGYVDEIVDINNNAAPGTEEEVRTTKAIHIHEKQQGYGHAIQRGLNEATGDYIIIAEPDGTFVGHDVLKLLSYADDFDVVFGTRTSSSLIGAGANMGLFLKYGNFFVAKYMEFIFYTSQLTDAGCTMRLMKRKALEQIQPYFTVGGSYFGPEMMMLVIIKKIKFMEIPLNYKKRIGKSSVTGSTWKAFVLGLQMLWLVTKMRIKSWRGKYS